MKTLFSFLFLLFLFSAFTPAIDFSNSKGMKFVELSYGLFTVKSTEVSADKTSPTGEHGLLSGLELKKQTDTIPCKIGSEFGTRFRIETSKMEDIPVTVTWKFPAKMYNTDTKTEWLESTDTNVRPSNIETYTGYGIDENYEVLPGPWTLTISYKSKVLYTKTFILVK